MEVVPTMTNIDPSRPSPFSPDANQSFAERGSVGFRSPAFASVLEQAACSQGDRPSGETRPAGVEAAITHVFNAFGFFPASSPSDVPAPNPGLTLSDKILSASDDEVRAPPTAEDVPAANPAREARISKWSAPAPIAAGLVSPPGHDWRAATPGGNSAAPIGGSGPSRDQPVRARDRAEPTRASPRIPMEAARVERPSTLQFEAPDRSERSVRLSQHLPGSFAERHEKILFKIGAHIVELVARLEGLSEEEEQRLLDALSEALASHGFSLGAATINGRPIAAGLLAGGKA